MMVEKAGFSKRFGVRTRAHGEVFLKLVLLAALLYLFILSITLLGSAFKLFGKDFAQTIFQATSSQDADHKTDNWA